MDSIERWRQPERLAADTGVESARQAYVALLADAGVGPYAHLRLSVADQQRGDVRGATEHALAAFGGAHAEPGLLEMLCKQLLRLGEIRPALACAHALAKLDPPASALAEVGKMLSDRLLPDAALPLIQRAMRKGLNGAPMMHYLLGLNLMYAGRVAEARAALESSLRGEPALAPAHWTLAKLGGAEGRGARIDRLRRVLEGVSDADGDAPLLWYSLFHELDRDDRVGEAWTALERAMRLRRRQVPHDEQVQDALYAAATRGLERAAGRGGWAEVDEGPAPVFVVGMPRTGTTVIEQRLCAAADVASAGELRDLPLQMRWISGTSGSPSVDAALLDAISGADLGLLGQRYLDHTRWRARGHAFYSDKWPENHLAIGALLQALPQARVVHVRRAPMDTCFSNLKEWFAASYYYSYDMREVARQYARFKAYTPAVEALASPRVVQVEYESFVRDPEGTVANLMQSLRLPPRTGGGDGGSVATASSLQVREAVDARNVGSWARYAQWLAPMAEALDS